MVYLLDTDICIHLLKGSAPEAGARLRRLPANRVGTTSITAAELLYGAIHSAEPRANLERVGLFLAPLVQVPFDNLAATHFARIKHELASRGALIGPMDLLIAAATRASGATLVTNNEREFARVPALAVENWMK